jgi:hypothetical protein
VSETGDSPVAQALRRFAIAAEAEKDQRKRELEDLKFVDIPESQWPDEIRTIRKGGQFGTVSVAARPCLSLNQLDHPIAQVINQARSARLAIQVNPKSQATKDDAEVRQGLYRNIEVESRAQMARMWAFERAVKCGRGFYRVLKEFANDDDPDDLDIVIARILNQHSVYLDPFHQIPDGSDAQWALIVADIPFTRYKRDYAKKGKAFNYEASDLASYDNAALSSLGDDAAEWVSGEGEGRTVRVAEYFSVTADEDGRNRQIKWQKINAVEVLDEQVWEGRFIPIVQVIGREININGERRYVGIVGPAKDAQRSYNYMRSAEVEAIGLAPKAPFIVAEGQLEGYEPMWREAANRNFPFLQYRPVNLGGKFAPPPQRNVTEPAIQAISLASRQAKDDIQTITGSFNEAQGKSAGAGQSGRAIQALQQQSEQGTDGFLDNLANISMTYEAQIVLDLMPKIYDRPGRIVKILKGAADEPESMMVNAPFQRDPRTGQPQPLPPDTAFNPDQHEHYDLSKGSYSCTVSIGKSFTTKRQEANAMLGEMAQAMPEQVPLFADVWVRNMDIPDGDEIADRFKKMLPPALQDGDQQQNPQQMQAQLQQSQMQIQQLTQQLQEAQAGIAKAQIDAESREKVAAATLESKERLAQMEADMAAFKEQVRAHIEQQKIDADQFKTAATLNAQADAQAREHAHQSSTHAVDLQQEVGMAHLGHVHTTAQIAAQPKPATGAK